MRQHYMLAVLCDSLFRCQSFIFNLFRAYFFNCLTFFIWNMTLYLNIFIAWTKFRSFPGGWGQTPAVCSPRGLHKISVKQTADEKIGAQYKIACQRLRDFTVDYQEANSLELSVKRSDKTNITATDIAYCKKCLAKAYNYFYLPMESLVEKKKSIKLLF